MGISFKDDIDIFSYIKSIAFSQITKKATIETAKELKKLKVRRDTEQTGKEIITYARKIGETTLSYFIT